MKKLLLIVAIILIIDCEGVEAQNFTVKILDDANDVGLYTSIVLDRNNNPHISYYDATNKNLKYIKLNNGIGTPETVDDPGAVGLFTSVAIDILNNPYISYYDEGNEYLKLAYKETANSTWEKKLGPATNLANCHSTSLVLNSVTTNPIIAYFDNNDQNMKLTIFKNASGYLPNGQGDFATEIVTTSATWMEDVSLILDNGSEPHIAFINLNGVVADLNYAEKICLGSGCLTQVTSSQPTGEGSWIFEIADPSDALGPSVSLDLDASGNPHISYYNWELRYSTKTNGTWTSETVDNSADVGKHSSIVLDSNGNPHISYYDATNGNLKYATKVNGTWSIQTLDALGDVGLYTSIALSEDNKPHISYYDATNGNLKYASVEQPFESGSIYGKVTSGTKGYKNTEVKLYTINEPTSVFSSQNTEIGEFKFSDIPIGTYSICIPDVYIIENNCRTIEVSVNADLEVNFNLLLERAEYWWAQFHSHTIGEAEQLKRYVALINRVYTNFFNLFSENSFTEWEALLSSNNDGFNTYKSAKRQLGALLLNIASNKLTLKGIISKDNRNAVDLVIYLSRMLENPEFINYSVVVMLASKVNDNQKVPEGLVPNYEILRRNLFYECNDRFLP